MFAVAVVLRLKLTLLFMFLPSCGLEFLYRRPVDMVIRQGRGNMIYRLMIRYYSFSEPELSISLFLYQRLGDA